MGKGSDRRVQGAGGVGGEVGDGRVQSDQEGRVVGVGTGVVVI